MSARLCMYSGTWRALWRRLRLSSRENPSSWQPPCLGKKHGRQASQKRKETEPLASWRAVQRKTYGTFKEISRFMRRCVYVCLSVCIDEFFANLRMYEKVCVYVCLSVCLCALMSILLCTMYVRWTYTHTRWHAGRSTVWSRTA